MFSKIYAFLFFIIASLVSQAQDFGLSFSYFIPKNGYFSTPVSPFSMRGLGVNLNRFTSIETGGSLYRMSGLNVIDMPFVSNNPIVGPNFTLFVPAEIVLQLTGNRLEFDIKGGGFGFLPFANKINNGNLDKAIRQYENWAVVNSSTSFDTNIGFGWMAGVELTIHVTSQIGISLETNYLSGNAKFPLSGTYTGGSTTIETKTFNYTEAKIDLTGLEFSIGVFMSSGGTAKKPKRRK